MKTPTDKFAAMIETAFFPQNRERGRASHATVKALLRAGGKERDVARFNHLVLTALATANLPRLEEGIEAPLDWVQGCLKQFFEAAGSAIVTGSDWRAAVREVAYRAFDDAIGTTAQTPVGPCGPVVMLEPMPWSIAEDGHGNYELMVDTGAIDSTVRVSTRDGIVMVDADVSHATHVQAPSGGCAGDCRVLDGHAVIVVPNDADTSRLVAVKRGPFVSVTMPRSSEIRREFVAVPVTDSTAPGDAAPHAPTPSDGDASQGGTARGTNDAMGLV